MPKAPVDHASNPYRAGAIATFILAPLILGIETWRRWGELLSPAALDDWIIFCAALVVAAMLLRRRGPAPGLWAFVCGGAWFMLVLSLWGSIYWRAQGDPSGVPVAGVIVFKAAALVLVSVGSWRALRQVRFDDPYRSARPGTTTGSR